MGGGYYQLSKQSSESVFLDVVFSLNNRYVITQMDTISNISKQTTCLTISFLEFHEHVFMQVRKIHLSGASFAVARKVCFLLLKDMFLEVQNETCS